MLHINLRYVRFQRLCTGSSSTSMPADCTSAELMKCNAAGAHRYWRQGPMVHLVAAARMAPGS